MGDSKNCGEQRLGLRELIAMGVGGMIGGGIFSVMGLAAGITGHATPFAFALGGLLALVGLLAIAGMPGVRPDNLVPVFDQGMISVFVAAALIFVAYEGFQLITNAVCETDSPQRNIPRAIYGSIAIMAVYLWQHAPVDLAWIASIYLSIVLLVVGL